MPRVTQPGVSRVRTVWAESDLPFGLEAAVLLLSFRPDRLTVACRAQNIGESLHHAWYTQMVHEAHVGILDARLLGAGRAGPLLTGSLGGG